MLNVRALNQLLSENADQKLFPRWCLITPNGLLIAHSTPADMRELRDQIALVSMTWKERLGLTAFGEAGLEASHSSLGPPSHRQARPEALETLTMEFDKRNIIVRYLQPSLLLVLEGGVPPSRMRPLKVTAESPGDPRYPPDLASADHDVPRINGGSHDSHPDAETELLQIGSPSAASQVSTAISSQGGRRLRVLDLHRKKLDALARSLTDEFQRTGFEMPEDPGDKFF